MRLYMIDIRRFKYFQTNSSCFLIQKLESEKIIIKKKKCPSMKEEEFECKSSTQRHPRASWFYLNKRYSIQRKK